MENLETVPVKVYNPNIRVRLSVNTELNDIYSLFKLQYDDYVGK